MSQGREKFDSKGLSCKSPWGTALERPVKQSFDNTHTHKPKTKTKQKIVLAITGETFKFFDQV